jgi:4-amino-4-deoxy-L-arabinose transferase-like glycosyltransferase
MRFTSLIVELIRARPALIFWVVVLAQALVWILIPTALYSSPPGDVALTLAYGREYLLSDVQGPPLSYWLADIAFRAGGNSLFGVFVLSQLCFVAAFWSMFRLGSAILGSPHAAIATLLGVTITAFSFPNVAFGPQVLAQPFWAALLLNFWRIVGEGQRKAWFAFSLHAGLLILTTIAALPLLAMLGVFALATARGRAALKSFDPVIALAVVAVLVLPYAALEIRTGALDQLRAMTPENWSGLLSGVWWKAAGWRWAELAGGLLLFVSGIVLLVLLNTPTFVRAQEQQPPTILRSVVDPLGRRFIYGFAIAPALVLSLASALCGSTLMAGGAGLVLLPVGLAVVLAAGDVIQLRRQRLLRTVWLWIVAAPAAFVIAVSLVQPWIVANEVRTMLPARAMGEFFADSFQRRTGEKLRAVAGDPQLAMLIGYAAPNRPHLLLDATPERTPWMSVEKFNESGGVVVWRAADTSGPPPAEIAQRFPGLVPEVPRTFPRLINGRQPLMRVGWAIVRPAQVAPSASR